MPTFEPTVKEIIAEMYKRFGHLLGAREIDEFAHDFGRSPAASEERPFGQWTTFEQWWTDAGCKFNDPEIMAVQAFEEGQRQALQSAPSSIEDAINPCVDPEFVRTMPGPEPNSPPAIKLATYLLAKLPTHWQYDEVRAMAKEVVTDEPSDAEQPRCTTCWALLPCKVHQPQPRTCQEEQD